MTHVNDLPTGSVTVSGTAIEDQILTAANTLADVDGLGPVSYQWQRNGTDITGETGTTYTLDDIDVGQLIRVVASYTDGQGTLESVNSMAVGPIANMNDAPVGIPTITGTTTEDQILTVNTGGISDNDGLGAFSYQWLRNAVAVGGATSSTYTLGDADVGTLISVQVSYTDGEGTAEGPLTSVQTAAIANVNDVPVGIPTITGTPTEDQILTANTGGISDNDGLGTFSYQWLRNGGAIGGATGNTYTLGDADVGTLISVQVSYTDAPGTAEGPLTSLQTTAIANVNDPPGGTVNITGTPTEDQILTAGNTLTDADGLGPISYQWQRGGVDISGATATTYTLVDADVGTLITVVASYTDGGSTAESVSSSPVGPIANINDLPGSTVTISGTPTEDQILTAANTLTDDDGLGTITYQWQRGGIDITGATATTYTLGDADVGTTITVVASYIDGQGTAENVSSSAVGPIANVNDVPGGVVTISGTPSDGQILTASNTLTDNDGLGIITYQWQRGGVDITGATATTYTMVTADVGTMISVVASYTDGHGTPESVSSSAVGPVSPFNAAPTGSVTISGLLAEDQVLTAANTLADADGLGIITYQWQRGGVDITGATATTYTLDDADVGAMISVVARYTDGGGTNESISSTAVGPIANVNDLPTGTVTISGIPTEDQILTAANTLADNDGLGIITYQWQRDGVDITGATATTYTLSDADVGTNISVVASYTDGHGTNENVSSTAVGPIANIDDAPTGSVTISGIPTEDQILTAANTLADNDGLGIITYQWHRSGVDITGATGTTYTLSDADVGTLVSVVASYTDGHGTLENVSSTAVGPIANVNDLPSGAVNIAGSPSDGSLLTASNTLTDNDGLGTISYQWKRNGVNIGGATAGTYTLVTADVGTLISVEAGYTDGQGAAEAVTSAAVGPVTSFNNAPTGSVNISGPPAEDQILTVSNTLADADGLGTITYQWKRNGVDVSGATATTFTLGDADVGTLITVVASYTDGGGTNESVASAAAGPIANVNDDPTITAIGDQVIAEDVTTGPLAFTVNDIETAAGSLIVTATSSDATLIPNGNIVLTNTGGGNWTVAANPAANQNGGPVTITVTVNDGTSNVAETFDVTVTPVNDAPSINAVGDQTIDEVAVIGTRVVQLTASDPDVADSLTFAIVGGNVNTAFSISALGEITLNKPLNFAATPEYFLTVEVQDSGTPTLSDTIVVRIVVSPMPIPAINLPPVPPPVSTDSETTETSELPPSVPAASETSEEIAQFFAAPPVAARQSAPVSEPSIRIAAVTAAEPEPVVIFVGQAIVETVIDDVPEASELRSDSGNESTARETGQVEIDYAVAAYNQPQLWDHLSELREQLGAAADTQYYTAASAIGFTSSLTVGYVLWAIRGGWLASSIIAQMPAWRLIDPLVVMSYMDQDEGIDGAREDDSIEGILQRGAQDFLSHSEDPA